MDSEALKPCPQDHWTVKAAIQAARTAIKAGDDLSLMAQISSGTAGRDDGLCAAIAHWTAERDKVGQMLRIIELEGGDPEIGAGVPRAEPRPTPADDGLVDRVARAIASDLLGHGDVEAERQARADAYWKDYRELATAAIAATGIEALQAQLAAAKAELARVNDLNDEQAALIIQQDLANKKMAAELARKDEALRVIVDATKYVPNEYARDANRLARAALGEPT